MLSFQKHNVLHPKLKAFVPVELWAPYIFAYLMVSQSLGSVSGSWSVQDPAADTVDVHNPAKPAKWRQACQGLSFLQRIKHIYRGLAGASFITSSQLKTQMSLPSFL